MDTVTLRKIGLTESQAKGYLALVENGSLTPTQLAEVAGETRTNAYAVCDKLVQLGLAEATEASKSSYRALSPSRLKQILIQKQKKLKETDNELSGVLPSLLSLYRLTNDQPGVLYLEGVDSLELDYDDIIKTGDTLLIFPCSEDRNDPKISDMIDKQILRQRKAKIKTKTLISSDEYEQFKAHQDELFDVRRGNFGSLDAQIMIFGPNVAITTYKTGIVTTIITSPMVAQTLRQLFQAAWDSDQPASESKENGLRSD